MQMKLMNWLKEHNSYSLTIAIVVFLLPIFIVHILFKISAFSKWTIANWTAGEVLGYCGEVLGAAATL